jgi:hypothetical protein
MGDVIQYASGDCVFDSAIASLALTNPNEIRSLIDLVGVTSEGRNVYSVTLITTSAQQILVDDEFLTDANGTMPYDPPAADPATGKDVLWAPLMRKANAIVHGGYGVGETAGMGFGETVGQANSFAMNPLNADAETLLKNAIDSNVASEVFSFANAAASRANTSGSEATDSLAGTFCVPGGGGPGYCVVAAHAYSVVSYDGDSVTIRNPWNTNAYGNGQGADGELTIPYEDFGALFEYIELAEPYRL